MRCLGMVCAIRCNRKAFRVQLSNGRGNPFGSDNDKNLPHEASLLGEYIKRFVYMYVRAGTFPIN